MTPIEILRAFHTIAVVGISARPDRHSHSVSAALQERGYRIIPVNPRLESVLGERCWPDLRSIPFPVEIVDIFRRSEHVGPIVDDAITVGARAVWMQIGVVDNAAAARAHAAGLEVAMDRCPLIELSHAALPRV